MSHLKMYYKVKPASYPENYGRFTLRKYDGTEQDRKMWYDLCKEGILCDNEVDVEATFAERISDREGYAPENVFFVEKEGKTMATMTILLKENNMGYLHMVAANPRYRGEGVGKYLADCAAAALYELGCTACTLDTQEYRVAALRSYLRAGFKPVLHEDDMEERWTKWLADHNYANVEAVDLDGNFVKTLCEGEAKKKVRVGVFGARRGSSIAQGFVVTENAYVSAVCDCDESTFKDIAVYCQDDTKYFTDFDEFIDSGMDAVILANYFHEHAKYAIIALEKGIHVYSETLPAVTMADCVAICRASEKSGAYYMLAENYAYFPSIIRLRELYQEGSYGKALYTEGEYVHPMSREEYVHYTPTIDHWRAQMPSGYYMTHALAPLMMVTDDIPVAVNARSIYCDGMFPEREGEPVKDIGSIMLCTMNSGSLARITGWAKFGGHGVWYRFACEKGRLETLRGDESVIRLNYNRWEIPEGKEEDTTEKVALSTNEKAMICGHAGGDYYAAEEFVNCILEGRQPYINAYRSCAMAAVGILGWRSSLNNGAEYKIPDFSNEEERKVYENDILSPFADENGVINYPRTKYEADKFDI